LIAGAIGVLAGGSAVALWAGTGGGGSRAEVEGIVRDYLLENPEILAEASVKLQEREAGKLVEANRAAIETPFAGGWAGAENGDVVLVEFFDYACGYCRKSNEDVDRLLKEDPKLKVVWREWPVLGPDSEAAAKVSLAAAREGKYRPFFNALFAAGRPTAAAVAQAQRAAGVSPQAVAAVQAGAAQELAKNHEIASGLRATGTPTFVVGDQVLQGAVGYEALKEAIAEARKGGA
jgi:protein-disulfide isomerase